MTKKYQEPQLEIQHFNVIDSMTADGSPNYSVNMPNDPDYGWEEW